MDESRAEAFLFMDAYGLQMTFEYLRGRSCFYIVRDGNLLAGYHVSHKPLFTFYCLSFIVGNLHFEGASVLPGENNAGSRTHQS